MHDVRPIVMSVTTMARYVVRRMCLRPVLYLKRMYYVAQYHRVNKPLKIREHNSVIVMAEKLLITL